MKKQKITVLSILFNFILIASLLLLIDKTNFISQFKPKDIFAQNNIKYDERTTLFDDLNTSSVDIAFVGDSLTERGLWSEFFTDKAVVNRGIESDTTVGLSERLDDVYRLEPKKVFILIGVNDLTYEQSADEIAKRYSEIADEMNQRLPNSDIYLQSLLPVIDGAYGLNNSDIDDVNEKIVSIAKENDMTYIDLNSKLKGENGQLISDYTVDGLHLTGDGYKVWAKEVSAYIN